VRAARRALQAEAMLDVARYSAARTVDAEDWGVAQCTSCGGVRTRRRDAIYPNEWVKPRARLVAWRCGDCGERTRRSTIQAGPKRGRVGTPRRLQAHRDAKTMAVNPTNRRKLDARWTQDGRKMDVICVTWMQVACNVRKRYASWSNTAKLQYRTDDRSAQNLGAAESWGGIGILRIRFGGFGILWIHIVHRGGLQSYYRKSWIRDASCGALVTF
jgi:hypothetical protein